MDYPPCNDARRLARAQLNASGFVAIILSDLPDMPIQPPERGCRPGFREARLRHEGTWQPLHPLHRRGYRVVFWHGVGKSDPLGDPILTCSLRQKEGTPND
jgi:hypothetical protein